ncbi:YcaO-like family protein [Streptomyces sp. NPDC088253]|uniref:YcaO-like family protein n=1 Tax=Streptomyces sp. NPDC088253 TaxID=3365846 RepID=UPI0038090C37
MIHPPQLPSSATTKQRYDGTERVIAPEQTLERIAPLLPTLGITRVARVTGLDSIGLPVWVACRPNSRSLSTSQGKGLTDAAARVSAVMECLELHHAERPHVPLRLASMRELTDHGFPIVEVAALPSVTTSRFHPSRVLLWTEATDIARQSACWIPFEVVHTSALLPAPTGSGCFASTSNGLASGNEYTEAVVHALCEAIERDAAAVWQQLPEDARDATLIDPDTVDDPDCQNVLERYAAAGIDVECADITSDVGVPAFLCQISDTADSWHPRRFSGMGCHLDPGIALLRALLEAAQSRLTYITGSRDDLLRRDYRAVAGDGCKTGSAERRGHQASRRFGSVPPTPRTGSFSEDLDVLMERLRAAGLGSVLVVDLTDPRFGVPVVRVVVPGLEGPDDDPAYVPGTRAVTVRRPS